MRFVSVCIVFNEPGNDSSRSILKGTSLFKEAHKRTVLNLLV
jgi:hypothetical protein